MPTVRRSRPRVRLNVVELERRDTPATFDVTLVSPSSGVAGDTDAVHTGGLSLTGGVQQAAGTTRVTATSAPLAVRAALSGAVQVQLGNTTTTYTFGPGTASGARADHKPYFVSLPDGRTGFVRLEDLAAWPSQSDWDYNDRGWQVSVRQVGGGTLTGGGMTPNGGGAPDGGGGGNDPPPPPPPPPPPASFPVMGSSTLTDMYDQTASVAWEITNPLPDTFHWKYTVTNNNLHEVTQSFNRGMTSYEVGGYTTGLANSKTNVPAWLTESAVARWTWSGTPTGMASGATGLFEFDTEPRPLVDVTAGAGGMGRYPTLAIGTVIGPAEPPQANLDIDGVADDKEEIPGGLVVKRASENNAPRKKVILQQIKDPQDATKPWIGTVELVKLDPKIIKVFTEAEAGTEITFNGTDNKFDNVGLGATGKSLWVQGDWPSADNHDGGLKARPIINGVPSDAAKDVVKFTVLWVDVTARYSKSDDVSATNDKRDVYKSRVMPEPGTYKLGRNRTQSPGGAKYQTIAFETVGRVSPNNFNWQPSDLKLSRDAKYALYYGQEQKRLAEHGKYPNGQNVSLPPGNDTSEDEFRDDTLDTNGYIFDLDTPGYRESVDDFDKIARMRYEMWLFAMITIDGKLIRASGIYSLSVYLSTAQASPGVWIEDNSVAGDNVAVPGEAKLTWNLQ